MKQWSLYQYDIFFQEIKKLKGWNPILRIQQISKVIQDTKRVLKKLCLKLLTFQPYIIPSFQRHIGSFTFFTITQSSSLMFFPLLTMYPNLIHFLMLNSIQIYHIHGAIPNSTQIKANALLALKAQSTPFLTVHMVITTELSCRMSS